MPGAGQSPRAPQIFFLEEGALFDRATLSIAEAECGNDASKALLVARYRALSRFRLQEYFDRQGARALLRRGRRGGERRGLAGDRGCLSYCSKGTASGALARGSCRQGGFARPLPCGLPGRTAVRIT